MLNGKVIVAYVDSNLGIYALGEDPKLSSLTPRFVGYSVSLNGGLTFEDKTAPPLSTQGAGTSDDGDAGDPVLAVDTSSSIVYLVGTSPRNAGHKGLPLWKSADGGLTFGNPTTIRVDKISTDKPWIAVDNATGTGQHDVYATFTTFGPSKLWLTVSTDYGVNFNTIQEIQAAETNGEVQSAVPIVGSDHTAYVFWFERNGAGVNWIKVRKALSRGTALGTITNVRQLVTSGSPYGNLSLKRSNSGDSSDTFRAFPFPVPAVNPSASKANHLYVAYADKGTGGDKADVCFMRSTDGGSTWTLPALVSTVASNDQWMPMLAVKPDGSKPFIAWYDRRT